MKEKSLISRFLIPLVFVVGVNLIAGFLYDYSSTIKPGLIRDIGINIFGPLTFFSLWFFGFVGPVIGYFRGAKVFERLMLAYANPVIWAISVELKVACQFSAIQLVYFFFLPWIFGIMCVSCMEFSISEIVCRLIDKMKRGADVKVFHPGIVAALVFGVTGVFVSLIKGQEWVYMVVHHYVDNFVN